MGSKTYEELNLDVCDLLDDLGLTTYPVNPFLMLRKLGASVIPYSSLGNRELALAMTVSEDAFHIRSESINAAPLIVAINNRKSFTRMRFSAGHELGHIIRNHVSESERNESEANYFAGYLLAPDPLVAKYCPSLDVQEIMDIFRIGPECAKVARDHTSNWLKYGGSLKEYEKHLLDNCEIERRVIALRSDKNK